MSQGAGSPYTSMVVGTDGSATATEAVRRCAALAQRLECPLLIAVAYRRTSAAELGPPSVQAQMPSDAALSPGFRGASELGQDAAGMASSVAPGVDVDTAAVEGEAAEALLDLAEARPGSLLAVGSQGMTGSRRFLLGAVPNKVSHHAPGDVLIGNKGMTGGGRFLLGGVPNKVSHHVETDLLIVKTDRD